MLFDQIQADLKQSQLERDEVKVNTLRMLLSELRYSEIQKREDVKAGEREQLSDEEVVSVVAREIKKRKEAAAGFRGGNREDAALKEEAEAKILAQYLPEQLSDEQLQKIIEDAINETGANSIADMGKVIGMVMGKVKGQADGGRVSGLVKEMLGKGKEASLG